jgi:uncharacterized membrane protein
VHTSPLQGRDELTVNAPAAHIWAVLEDTGRLPAWVPMVHRVDAPTGRREHVGATRTCDVQMMGRRGQITERCAEMTPQEWLYYVLDAETLGFARLVDGFGFSIALDQVGVGTTTVSLASYYQPRGLLGRVANRLVLARQLRRSRRAMLAHLERLVDPPSGEPDIGRVGGDTVPSRLPSRNGER